MKLGRLEISFKGGRYGHGRVNPGSTPAELATPPASLTEEELNGALANLTDAHPAWKTLMQLIAVAMDNAYSNANASITSTNELAGYVAGGEHLKMFRDELRNRRQLGQEAAKPIPLPNR